MNKDQWQKLHDSLHEIHKQFTDEWPNTKGRTKAIRARADNEVNHIINKADRLISGNKELYDLITGEENGEFGQAIRYDEFLQSHHFGGDMKQHLRSIKEKIDSFEEDEIA